MTLREEKLTKLLQAAHDWMVSVKEGVQRPNDYWSQTLIDQIKQEVYPDND